MLLFLCTWSRPVCMLLSTRLHHSQNRPHFSFRLIPTRPGLMRLTSVLQRCWAVAKLQQKVLSSLFNPNHTQKKATPTKSNPTQPPTPTPSPHFLCSAADVAKSCFYCDTCRVLHTCTYHTFSLLPILTDYLLLPLLVVNVVCFCSFDFGKKLIVQLHNIPFGVYSLYIVLL